MSEAYDASITRLRDLCGTPRDPGGRARISIAELQRRSGDPTAALATLDEVLDAFPDDAAAHTVRTRAALDLSDHETARVALGRLLALDPGSVEGARLGGALAAAEESAALDWARAQGQGPPVEVDQQVATRTLGELYLSQGALEQAEGVFERLLTADPDNDELQALLERARGNDAPADSEISPQGAAGVDSAPEVADDLESRTEPGATAETIPTPVPVAELAPEPVPVADLAPEATPVADLAPEAVPVASLAPTSVHVASLAPDPPGDGQATAAGESGTPPEGMDDFMAWLDDH